MTIKWRSQLILKSTEAEQESEIAVLKNMFTLQQQQLERIENLLSQRQFLS